MDSIKGAIMLRERFEQNSPSPISGASPAADDALPLFHWVAGSEYGVPAAPAEADGHAAS